MSFPKKAIVAVDTTLEEHVLFPLKEIDFLANSEVHFVHVVHKIVYPNIFAPNLVFPLPEDEARIQKANMDQMKVLVSEFVPQVKNAKFEVFFATDAKVAFCDYVKSSKADLVIVASRLRHGVFDGSFASYVNKHVPCAVLITRSHTK